MKTLWYSLAFGISVTLHATLLLFGDPTHRAEIPVEQGHATLAINLVASVQSRATPPEVHTVAENKTVPQPIKVSELKKVPDTFIENGTFIEKPTPLAAPVIESVMPTLPAIREPTLVVEPVENNPVVEPVPALEPVTPVKAAPEVHEIKPITPRRIAPPPCKATHCGVCRIQQRAATSGRDHASQTQRPDQACVSDALTPTR